ncbi:unnamed protein product [Pedinophyceae sp. YPF-701]|nr:unnamed protein product [Pedinophyceae sp. YPF-701]
MAARLSTVKVSCVARPQKVSTRSKVAQKALTIPVDNKVETTTRWELRLDDAWASTHQTLRDRFNALMVCDDDVCTVRADGNSEVTLGSCKVNLQFSIVDSGLTMTNMGGNEDIVMVDGWCVPEHLAVRLREGARIRVGDAVFRVHNATLEAELN